MKTVPLRGSALRWAIIVSSGAAYVLFGYDQGVLGGLNSQPLFLEMLGNPSPGLVGTIMAMFYPSCVVGSALAAIGGNKFGRRKLIFLGTAIMTIGVILQTAMHSQGQFIAGRVITGLGNGLITSTIPVYVAETSPQARRGTMVCLQLNVCMFGVALAYWIDYGTVRSLSGAWIWRMPIGLQLVFCVITVSTIMFLPESPRWLYLRGKKAEATKVFAALMDCSEDDQRVQFTIEELADSLELERTQKQLSLREILSDKSDLKLVRRLIICFCLPLFVSLTGNNVLTFYLPRLLEGTLHLSSNDSSLVAGFVELAYWIGCFPPLWTVERLGRRVTLLTGSVVLAISMILFTIALNIDTPPAKRLALAMLVLINLVNGMSWTSLQWVIPPEITPLHLRHVGGAVGAGSQWLSTMVIVLMAPAALANVGWKIFLLFDIGIVLSGLFVYFFLPETQGKTLEQIDYIFVSGNGREHGQPEPSDAQLKVFPESQEIENV